MDSKPVREKGTDSCLLCRWCVKVPHEIFLRCKKNVWKKPFIMLDRVNEITPIGLIFPRHRKIFNLASTCKEFINMEVD